MDGGVFHSFCQAKAKAIFSASAGAGASTSQSACHGCDSELSANNPSTTSNSRPPSLSALRDDNPGIGTAMPTMRSYLAVASVFKRDVGFGNVHKHPRNVVAYFIVFSFWLPVNE